MDSRAGNLVGAADGGAIARRAARAGWLRFPAAPDRDVGADTAVSRINQRAAIRPPHGAGECAGASAAAGSHQRNTDDPRRYAVQPGVAGHVLGAAAVCTTAAADLAGGGWPSCR